MREKLFLIEHVAVLPKVISSRTVWVKAIAPCAFSVAW